MRLHRRHTQSIVRLNMTPMIDIVFLLLIFFMTVSQISRVERAPVELPRQPGARDQEPAILTVNVLADGSLMMGGLPANLSLLITLASEEIVRHQDNPRLVRVVIRADRRAPARAVNEVVKALRRLQIESVRMAVQAE